MQMQRRRGQSMVEMALILPAILLLFLGIIDFGWYLYNYVSLDNAARRGAEQAAKEAPLPANASKATDGCVQAVKAETKRNLVLIDLPDSGITLTYVYAADGNSATVAARKLGDPVEVRVRYTGAFLTPLFRSFGQDTFTFDFRSRRSILNTNITPEMVSVNGTAIGCQ
jgi:Flp pilus assembly protein TadG